MEVMKLVSIMVMALCLSDVSFGAKTNPFIKGMTESEITKLRRKAPYVDQVYNPETNEVHYDVVLNRLKDTPKKISDVEENFINQVKRNLQREYWANATRGKIIQLEPMSHMVDDGYWSKHYEIKPSVLNAQANFRAATFKNEKGAVNNPWEGFDNYRDESVDGESYNPMFGRFYPEDFGRYRSYGHRDSPNRRSGNVHYSMLLSANMPAVIKTGDGADAHYEADKYYYQKNASGEPYSRSESSQKNISSNMTTLEKIFNSITSGVENVNRVYDENNARKEQERQDAINRAIKAEAEIKMREAAHAAEIERMKKESEKSVNQEREIARTKSEEQETQFAEKIAELQNKMQDLQQQIEDAAKRAKEQSQRHTTEVLTLEDEILKQKAELSDVKAAMAGSQSGAAQQALEGENIRITEDPIQQPNTTISKLYEIVLCSSGMEISPWYIPMVPRDVLEDIYVRIMIKIRTYVEDFYQRVEDEEKTFRVIENIKKTLASFPKCPLAPVKEDLVRKVWLDVLNTDEHLDRFLNELREARLIKD